MSQLQRDLAQSHFQLSLPLQAVARPMLDEDEGEDEAVDTASGLQPMTVHPRKLAGSGSLAPLSASTYFQEALEVDPGFRVYYTPPRSSSKGVVFVCHHGAGYSALSFACLANELRTRTNGEVGCLAYDARGHGKSTVGNGDGRPPDLPLETLADDLIHVLARMFPERARAPSLILVGHSMGGAVVAEACNRIQKSVAPVLGLTILDVVEGSAIEALQFMRGLIASRPTSFDTVEQAIEWHLTTKTLSNADSARVSVPSLVRSTNDSARPYIWITDLSSSERYWSGWFTGLSTKFLTARAAKLLVLAGTDRLDTELMIGQMQGKYQLVVMQEVGHCLQEDAPDRLAVTLIEFWHRNDQDNILKNVKKVGS